MISVMAAVAGFVGMEGVSYAAHRWVMHSRRGMVWHASHHAPPAGGFERNDLFPLCFSVVGITLFALAAGGVAPRWVWWLAAGITAYGGVYLLVHEVFIHRRLAAKVPPLKYFRWLRDSHSAHHLDGGEPYGMLLPLMSTRNRRRVQRSDGDRDIDDPLSRSKQRATRSRL
jgi:beta-carotene 3-hydroxylase